MPIYNTPPCPMCGSWMCLDCTAIAGRRGRYFTGQHSCSKCKSFNGEMLPTHHRPATYEDHAAQFDPQAISHYPLEKDEPTTTKAS